MRLGYSTHWLDRSFLRLGGGNVLQNTIVPFLRLKRQLISIGGLKGPNTVYEIHTEACLSS